MYAKDVMKNEVKAKEIFKGNVALQEAYKNMANAKSARDKASGDYEKARMRYERGEGTAEEVDKARVNSLKASSSYDNQNEVFKTTLAANPSDKELYNAYSKVEDLSKDSSAFAYSSQNSTSTVNSSTQQSSPTQTVGGVAVSNPAPAGGVTTKSGTHLEAGERVTRSGIILPGGVDKDKRS